MAATASADEEGGEESADPAALTAVKKARADYQSKMQKTLTKDQWKTYEASVDAVMQAMFEAANRPMGS